MLGPTTTGKYFHRAITLSCILFLALMQIQIHAADDLDAIKEKFIGDYELVSYFQFPASGGEVDMKYIGRLSYDALGNMSGIGMPVDLPARAAQSSERRTGGFAYWGKVSYDLEQGIVFHHVEGSPLVPQWVGGENIRYFEFTDELLKLSLKDEAGKITATLSWRKLK